MAERTRPGRACRAPTSATTCVGTTPTDAQLSYDNEGRLATWQNAPSSSLTSTDQFLSDGAGQRVEQQATSGGATTTTVYVGQVEELSTTSTTTTYYYAGGKRIALPEMHSTGYRVARWAATPAPICTRQGWRARTAHAR